MTEPVNLPNEQAEVKLTSYSHGAGCGCKLSPRVLDEVLKNSTVGATATAAFAPSSALIVGNASRDDAAVYDLGDGRGLISTTDFFLPIVDDPMEFGRIAATNAISDVYAMGGSPLMAIAILGWPIDKLSASVANQVVEGGRAACAAAGIPLAGGHSIDNPEPIFGLAVSGIVELANLKRNDGARPGSRLYLTKPLGIGILSTAQKNGALRPEHARLGPETMLRLNDVGAQLGKLEAVSAMTDVTGFGLLGHLLEICEGSGLDAVLAFDAVPVIPAALEYIAQGQIPGGTKRNWSSYKTKIGLEPDDPRKTILSDAQTSGGLLIAADPAGAEDVERILNDAGLYAESIGTLTPAGGGPRILVS
jgi:selenide,water dikinase